MRLCHYAHEQVMMAINIWLILGEYMLICQCQNGDCWITYHGIYGLHRGHVHHLNRVVTKRLFICDLVCEAVGALLQSRVVFALPAVISAG